MQRLADEWVDLELRSEELARWEDKLSRQYAWLVANDDHPEADARWSLHRVTKGYRDRCHAGVEETIKRIEKVVRDMDQPTRERAAFEVHAWAGDDEGAWARVRQIAPFRSLWPAPVKEHAS